MKNTRVVEITSRGLSVIFYLNEVKKVYSMRNIQGNQKSGNYWVKCHSCFSIMQSFGFHASFSQEMM